MIRGAAGFKNLMLKRVIFWSKMRKNVKFPHNFNENPENDQKFMLTYVEYVDANGTPALYSSHLLIACCKNQISHALYKMYSPQ